MAVTKDQILALLKERYLPGIVSQINTENVLLSELGVTKRGIDAGGRYAVIALQTGFARGAGARARGANLPQAVSQKFNRSTFDLTRQYAAEMVEGFAEGVSAANASSYAEALSIALNGVREAMNNSLATQIWTASHGGFAQISAVSGTGPWEVTLTSRQAIVGNFVGLDMRVQTGTVASGTMTSKPGVLVVSDVDESENTVTLTVASDSPGTPAPTAGDYILAEDTANECLYGVEELVSKTAPVQNIDPATDKTWRACVQGNGGSARAASTALVRHLTNEIKRRSGEYPSLILTTPGVENQLHDEFVGNIRYADPSKVERGEGVMISIEGSPKVKTSFQGTPGSLFALNTSHINVYSPGDFEFLEQGGSNMLRLQRTDDQEVILKRYMQVATDKRVASGRLDDLNDPTAD